MAVQPGATPAWLDDQVRTFAEVRPRYKLYAQELKDVLLKAAARLAPLAIVQARAKSIQSFGEKAMGEWSEHPDPVNQFTDLCGARVIAPTRDGVGAMCEFVVNHFEIDRENSVTIEQRLKPTEFGYRSVHYIVSFKPGVFPTRDVDVHISGEAFGLKAEVQVRTILEHAWADFTHDRSYKGAFKVPEAWERRLLAIAAMLEVADGEFMDIHKGLGAYAATYGQYLTKEELRREIALLETILAHDPNNAGLAGRIGKLAIAAEDWDKAVSVLECYSAWGHSGVLRDLGVATCKLHRTLPCSEPYRRGQRYLDRAMEFSPRDVDAICSLAGTWKKLDEAKVASLYQSAFNIDATDPYVLCNHLESQISRTGERSLVDCLGPIIRQSIERCQNQAAVGMNMPWAHYSRGLFHLLLDERYASLAAYAEAIETSSASFMIATSLQTVDRLAAVRGDLSGYDWARRLLMLGLLARFPSSDDADRVQPELMGLASPDGGSISGPVVILAGGCDVSVEQGMQQYQQLLLDSFRGFEGTLVGGGTTAGISGIVADVQERYPDTIATIGYVPEPTPQGALIDGRYREVRRTQGQVFSASESLQCWTDLLAAGIVPSDVRLLVINGGQVTAADVQIALALGANVAVIEGSGREAAKLLAEAKQGRPRRIAQLPPESPDVSAFVA